jgi:hypothetical protein
MSAWKVLLLPLVTAGLLLAIVTPAGSSRARSGDPGGRILSQLEAIHRAIPADSAELEIESQEPIWISSCSDEYLKKGWSSINYAISFASQQTRSKVLAEVTNKMKDLGWGKRFNVPGGSWAWKRRLPTGNSARASISYFVGPWGAPPWSISATAVPPRPVGECAGG